jgi:Tfp pilus assembly protein PilN
VTPLNLASRPFRNERLPALAFALGAAAVLGLTLWHGLALRRVLPADGSTLRAEVAALDNELAALESEERSLVQVRPEPAVVGEWRRVQALVDQRVFAWTQLLGRLEELLPPGVRLLSITPAVEDGVASLELRAEARGLEDGYRFWEALLHSGDFEDVMANSIESEDDGARFGYSMRYRPRAAPAPAPEREAGEDSPGEAG